ncbi:hypothetical protein HDIA_2003 [Hartmannibacter diazotrophicus]|uniref:Uncharacterized protein n=1 Tax=Hartmannibacter diazotrophicus TaxID=1482074 RepID=A0A2C9D5F1_9HYPH|nr:hypothetical protein [Hartmannibacter diazotrophicus]SON55544.1 hypothetical protein HDIA_2003 [Hartmannibacter diazotrophicus]
MYINDSAFDAALNWIKANGLRLDICSAEPATYAGVAAVSLGNKDPIAIAAPADGAVSGRKVSVPQITDGAVSADGDATFWAITNGADTLIATGALAASQTVTNGNTFTLAAFDVTFLDAA